MSASTHSNDVPAIGIIGGSGLYDIDGFSDREELSVSTPFGDPSDKIIAGTLQVATDGALGDFANDVEINEATFAATAGFASARAQQANPYS